MCGSVGKGIYRQEDISFLIVVNPRLNLNPTLSKQLTTGYHITEEKSHGQEQAKIFFIVLFT